MTQLMPTCPLCARPVRSRLVRDDLPREWRDRPLRIECPHGSRAHQFDFVPSKTEEYDPFGH
jgi:hypothetical protein